MKHSEKIICDPNEISHLFNSYFIKGPKNILNSIKYVGMEK